MATKPGGNPAALGLVTVAAAGTPVSVLQNFSGLDTDAEARVGTLMGRLAVKSIFVQAKSGNSGVVYVGTRGMDSTTGDGVIAELAAGAAITIHSSESMNLFNLLDFFIDAATNDDAAYVTAVRV